MAKQEASELLQAERDENTQRKNFTPSEAVEMGKRLTALLKPAAEQRQKEAGKHGSKGGRGKKKQNPSGKLPEGKRAKRAKRAKGETKEQVAEAVGMSRRTPDLGACGMADEAPHFECYHGKMSPTEYVLSTNFKRRHLTVSQRATVAAESLPMLQSEAAERRRATQNNKSAAEVEKVPPQDHGKARDKAAKLANVNPRYVQDAARIKAEAPEVFLCRLLEVHDVLGWRSRRLNCKPLARGFFLHQFTVVLEYHRRAIAALKRDLGHVLQVGHAIADVRMPQRVVLPLHAALAPEPAQRIAGVLDGAYRPAFLRERFQPFRERRQQRR